MFNYLEDCKRVADEAHRPEVSPTDIIFSGNPDCFSINENSVSSEAISDPRVLEFVVQNLRRQIHQLELATSHSSAVVGNPGAEVTEGFRLLNIAAAFSESNGLRKHLQDLRVLLKPVLLYPSDVFSSVSCGSSSAKSLFFHGFIAWRWSFLSLLLRVELSKLEGREAKLVLTDSQFEVEFQVLLLDLTYIAHIRFAHSSGSVGCNCFRKVWRDLHLLAKRLSELHYFGDFNKYLRLALDPVCEGRAEEALKALWKRLPVQSYFSRLPVKSVAASDPDLFRIWLVCGLAEALPEEASEVLQDSFSSYLKTELPEDKMRQLLLAVTPPVIKFWAPDCDLISLLWGALNKRLNSAFFVQNSSLDALIVVDSTGEDYIANLQSQLDSELTSKRTSFSLFLTLIHRSLLKCRTQKSLSNKIFSRIFSKLQVPKLISLSERGLHNLVELVVTLAISSDLLDTGSRLSDLLLQLQFSKLLPERQKIVAKGHAALVQLLFDAKVDLSKYFERLLAQQSESSASPVVTKLLAQLSHRFLGTSEDFSGGVVALLGPWVFPFLWQGTNETDKQIMFELFCRILGRIRATADGDQRGFYQISKAMFDHVLPSVKQHYLKASSIDEVPRAAALFCICARGTNGIPAFQQLFSFFGDINRPNARYSLEFYTVLLQHDFAGRLPSALVVQQWIKFYLILDHEETKVFSDLVARVPEISEILEHNEKGKPTTIVTFFELIFKIYFGTPDFQRKSEIASRAERYLSNFEKWASTQGHTPEATLRIYQFFTTLLFKCGPMLYSPAKSSCFLNTVFQNFVLTPNIMMGKQPPSPATVQAMMKAFPYLLELLTKMNFQTDPNLSEKLSSLVFKWTPILISTSKITTFQTFLKACKRLDQEGLQWVVSGVSRRWLESSGSVVPEAAWAAELAKFLVLEIKDEQKVKLMVQSAAPIWLEHLVLVPESAPSRQHLSEVFQELDKNGSPEVVGAVLESLKPIARRKLIHYEKKFFFFLRKLSETSPSLVRKYLPHLKEAILEVEGMLGVSKDTNLRSSYTNLQAFLNK